MNKSLDCISVCCGFPAGLLVLYNNKERVLSTQEESQVFVNPARTTNYCPDINFARVMMVSGE